MHQDVLRALTSQVDWWWAALFRPRLQGLTDEECGSSTKMRR